MGLVCASSDREFLLNDLEEEYQHCLRVKNRSAANVWYWGQVFRSLLPCLRRRWELWTWPQQSKELEMNSIWFDVKLGIRRVVRSPGYAAVILITITLAAGACTTVFSVVNGVLLSPLPHPNPEQLVLIYEVDRRGAKIEDRNPVAPANFLDWRTENRSFQGMAAFSLGPARLSMAGEAEQVSGGFVSEGFFDTLGVEAIRGRTLDATDFAPDSAAAVMVSHRFWRERLAGSDSVVGDKLQFWSTDFTVVGVLPPGFRFLGRQAAVWMPSPIGQNPSRRSHSLRVVGRLSGSVSLQRAQDDLDRVTAGLQEQHPELMTGWGVKVTPMSHVIVSRVRSSLLLFGAAVLFVFLIAVVNITALTLARGSEDIQGMAIRRALGAGSWVLLQSRLVESLFLCLLGAAGAIGFAWAAQGFLRSWAAGSLPRLETVGLDGRVFLFAILAALFTGVSAGLAPIVMSLRTDLTGGLQGGTRSGGPSRGRSQLRSVLVVAQVAFTVLLLISASLMSVTFLRLSEVDPGFTPEHVQSMKLWLPSSIYPDNRKQIAFWDQALEEAASLPGVGRVAISRFLPFEDSEWTFSIQIDGQPPRQEGEKRDYAGHAVSPSYFETMGIRLLQGRSLSSSDRLDAPAVAVINETLVTRFFPDGGNPLGKSFYVIADPEVHYQIVGVSEDVRHYALDDEAMGAFFVSYRQPPRSYMSVMNLVVKSPVGGPSVYSPIKERLRALEPALILGALRPMMARLANSVSQTYFSVLLLSGFAIVALAIAIVGVYGIISGAVGQRSQEIGIRVAVGAPPSRVARLFVAQGVRLAVLGTLLGLVSAAFFTRLQTSLLYGVNSLDPLTYIAVAVLFCLLAGVASFIPARRASRIDPVRALRAE